MTIDVVRTKRMECSIDRVVRVLREDRGPLTVKMLARRSDFSVAAVRYAIRELVRRGAVVRVSRKTWIAEEGQQRAKAMLERARSGKAPSACDAAVTIRREPLHGLGVDLEAAEKMWRELMGDCRFVDVRPADWGAPRRLSPDHAATLGGVARAWA